MKKILCYRNSKLGDYLISIPSIRLIKKKNKNCKIYFLTVKSKFYNNLPKNFEKTKLVDEFIYFNNNFLDKFRLIFFLRKKNFDKIYYLQEKSSLFREVRDYIFFNFLKIDKINGFFTKQKDYSQQNETLQIARRVDKKITHNNINLLSKIKKDYNEPIFSNNYFTISIGGFSQPSIWNLKNWIVLIKLLRNRFKHKILIVGTKHDFKKANMITLRDKKNIINLCNKTNIKDLSNIIKFSKYHITNDNGSMHLATLYEKKTICLFNNHDPKGKWYPSNKNAIILRPNKGVNLINPYKVFSKLIRTIYV
jgi:ADP-heptose:LPS heptosyltransferase